jgi:hypothetical protein
MTERATAVGGMKRIALMTVRNDAWVLPHSLACLSGFCDHIIVSDQGSDDGSDTIARAAPKVTLLEIPAASEATARLPQQARWRLLDAARQYDGYNVIWISDADELVSPRLAGAWLDMHEQRLTPGTPVECLFYNLWSNAGTYRDDWTVYRPHWKPMTFVDDRRADYPRSPDVPPLHEPRLPLGLSEIGVRAETVPVLHLQWLVAERNQMKQAWYRCIELIDGRTSPAAINERYALTLPLPFVKTTPVPQHWVTDVTVPDFAVDAQPSWHEREVLAWFDAHGVERFEALEIWHVKRLRREFHRRTGRQPRPLRSDTRPWPARAREFGRRAASAAWRRMFA